MATNLEEIAYPPLQEQADQVCMGLTKDIANVGIRPARILGRFSAEDDV